MKDKLMRPALNCEITNILASGKNGKRLWMRCNPAAGTMVFVVANGKPVCETLSLQKAIDAYNDIGREVAA